MRKRKNIKTREKVWKKIYALNGIKYEKIRISSEMLKASREKPQGIPWYFGRVIYK
ncbi:MAG: hypothetical protein Q6363_005700 [Candidatus Njordarchaeota archaeon]